MLNRRLVATLLGGGAGLVCSTSLAFGQPYAHGEPIEQVGDPTPETLPHCDMHLFPKNDNPHPEGIPAQTPFGWLYNYSYPPAYSSWADTPELSPWLPDRRPMMTVQLGSAKWAANSRGNPDYWWITSTYIDNNQNLRIREDTFDGRVPFDPLLAGQDKYSPNIPESMGGPVGGTFNSDNEWVMDGNVVRYAPNGVPDQFDALIRTILRWRDVGVRRVLLHLPAGVTAGKFLGFDSAHPNDPTYKIFAGTTQSMNQFLAMPLWKRDYFLGVPRSMGNFQSRNAWDEFLAAFCSNNNPDPMDIEVYIGGGIPVNGAGLDTERTDVNFPANDPNPGYVDRLVSYEGLDEDNEEVRAFVWREWNGIVTPPVPIDPRHTFTFFNPPNQPVQRHGNISHVYNAISPWFSAGINRIWFDTASENFSSSSPTDWGHERRWGAVEIAHNPWIRANNVRIGGETIPTFDIGTPTVEILDDCAVANMPWFANFSVLSKPHPTLPGRLVWKAYAETTLSRNTTEVHVLDDTDKMEWHHFQYAREHGYVVGAWNAYSSGPFPKTAEMMKRWYSIGKIKVADFNGDGVINNSNPNLPNDYTMAYDAIQRGKGYASSHNNQQIFPAVFGNGDLDGNGIINDDDWTYFDGVIWPQHIAGNNIVRDYQDPLNPANHDY